MNNFTKKSLSSNHSLKNTLLCIFLFFSSLLLMGSCSKDPDFYFIDGKPAQLSDYDGRWLLINYWAVWCKPCLEEVPELNLFYQQHKQDYGLIAISFDPSTSQELAEQVKKYQMNYPMVASKPTPKLGIPLPSSLPANYLRSPRGKIYGPLVGPQTSESLLKAFEKAKSED